MMKAKRRYYKQNINPFKEFIFMCYIFSRWGQTFRKYVNSEIWAWKCMGKVTGKSLIKVTTKQINQLIHIHSDWESGQIWRSWSNPRRVNWKAHADKSATRLSKYSGIPNKLNDICLQHIANSLLHPIAISPQSYNRLGKLPKNTNPYNSTKQIPCTHRATFKTIRTVGNVRLTRT